MEVRKYMCTVKLVLHGKKIIVKCATIALTCLIGKRLQFCLDFVDPCLALGPLFAFQGTGY